MPRIYVAGPMTGLPHFNFPAFFDAEATLVNNGWTVYNPARVDLDTDRVIGDFIVGFTITDKFDLGEVLLDDLQAIRDGDAVFFLNGWADSKGAKVEYAFALALDKSIYYETVGYPTTDEWGEALADDTFDSSVNLSHSTLSFTSSTTANTSGMNFDSAFGGGSGTTYTPPIPTTFQPQRVTQQELGQAVDKSQPLDRDEYADAIQAAHDILATGKVHPRRVTATDEVRVTSATGGQKGKKLAQLGAVDPVALTELAKVAGFGAEKYDRANYLKGFDWSLAFDAAMRHLLEFNEGHDIDPESGLSAAAHAAWQCLALVSFQLRQIGTDDRPPRHD